MTNDDIRTIAQTIIGLCDEVDEAHEFRERRAAAINIAGQILPFRGLAEMRDQCDILMLAAFHIVTAFSDNDARASVRALPIAAALEAIAARSPTVHKRLVAHMEPWK